jgi:hypothetical protein
MLVNPWPLGLHSLSVFRPSLIVTACCQCEQEKLNIAENPKVLHLHFNVFLTGCSNTLHICNITSVKRIGRWIRNIYVEINQLNTLNYILLYLSFALLSHIMMFFLIHILYCHSSCIYLLYDFIVFRLSPTALALKWLRKEHSRSLRMELFCRNM